MAAGRPLHCGFAFIPRSPLSSALVSLEMSDPEPIVIARYAAGRLSTEDLVEYADRKLVEGAYSDHLVAILDETIKNWDTISPLFELAVRDLGHSIPSFENAISQLVRYHIGLIAAGNVDPLLQLSILWRDIDRFDLHKDVRNYVGDAIGVEALYGLYFAVDDLNDSSRDEGLQEIKTEIVVESGRWLKNH